MQHDTQQEYAAKLSWADYGSMVLDTARDGDCGKLIDLADGLKLMAAAAQAIRVLHPHLTTEQKEILRVAYEAEYERIA